MSGAAGSVARFVKTRSAFMEDEVGTGEGFSNNNHDDDISLGE